MKPRRRGRALPLLPADEDVRRELQAHLELRTEDLISTGVPDIEARQRARREFGDLEGISRECIRISESPRSHRTITDMLDSIRQDTRFAIRTLLKNPAFSIVAVLTVGLGIGANTAIFSVVNGVLLRPLPYPEPDRLVALWERSESGNDNNVAAANFIDWHAQAESFESMALMPTHRFGGEATVLGGVVPARVLIGGVSNEFFDVMGVAPLLGRTFSAAEAVEGAPVVFVVSHQIWRTLLGEPATLDGATLNIGGSDTPVVGVMPPGFDFPKGTEIWYPVEVFGLGESRTAHNHAAVARLGKGVQLDEARAELDTIGRTLKAEYGEDTDAVGVNAYRLIDDMVGATQRPLWLLLGASGLVLLVACTNIASALLARGTARRAEIGVRASLGATRGRLVRQLLTESLLLTLVGAGFGIVIGRVVVDGALSLAPEFLPRAGEIGLDAAVLGFTLAVALITAVLFGLFPALDLARAQIADSLRSGRRTVAGTRRRSAWSSLAAVEIALALVLLIGSGLLIRSFWAVIQIDAGFDAERVMTVDVALPLQNYPEGPDVASYLQRLMDELRRVPEVDSVGLVSHLPLGGYGINGAFDVEGRAPGAGYADYRVAGGDYFAAMRIPVLRGRSFSADDHADAAPVAVINEALARDLWPGEDPIGRRIGNLSNDSWAYGDIWMTVIGIVGDVRHHSLTRPAPREVYVHYLQRPMRAREAILTLHTGGDPAALTAAIRAGVESLDAEVPARYRPMQQLVTGSVSDRRFTLALLGVFSAVALLLSALGIYGVISYAVARSSREIGIRLALGAEPAQVRRRVVIGSLRTTAAGILVGVLGALALTRVLESFLYEVRPTDPVTFASVVALLVGVAVSASYLPARRASRIDPMLTMRAE